MLTVIQQAKELTTFLTNAYLLILIPSFCSFARSSLTQSFADTHSIIHFDLVEERPRGTTIGNIVQRLHSITATSLNFSDLVIVANKPAVANMFQLEKTGGQLVTKRKLDRDILCQHDGICCPTAVSDSGQPHEPSSLHPGIQRSNLYRTIDECQIVFRVIYRVIHTGKNETSAPSIEDRSYITVVLNVIDINDNAPKFLIQNIPHSGQTEHTQSHLRSITTTPIPAVELWIDEMTEPDTCFELPVAVDMDSTKYGVTKYHLSKLSQTELLQRFGSSLGDNQVEAFESELPFVIMESSCSQLRWGASRQNFGVDAFSRASHDLSEHVQNRQLTPNVKLIDKLDRELIDEYWMKVIAIDSSESNVLSELSNSGADSWNSFQSVRHTGTLLVHVRVLDANDNSPEVSPTWDIQINEDVAVGTVIDTISGTDRDTGDNGRLTYLIDPDSTASQQQFPFKIHPISGALTVSQPLDADQSQYGASSRQVRFTVITSDAGKPVPRSAFTIVTVNIMNVNDETPQIKIVDLQSQTNPPRPSVRENQPPGQLIAFVTATDRDSGLYGSIRCQVDNQKFQLEVINPIVSIKDLSRSKAISTLPMDMPPGKHQNQLEFKLTTTVSLDHEIAAYEMVEISCTDQALTASAIRTGRARILVTVIDENDNPPKFDRDEYHLRIYENEAIGELITNFNATDDDQFKRPIFRHSNRLSDFYSNSISRETFSDFRSEGYRGTNRIKYHLDTVGDTYFRLDSLTGSLYSKVQFDREKQEQINFTVTATDGGVPSRNASVHVVMSIMDKNDNAPKFWQEVYENELFENQSVGSLVLELNATDLDVGNNAELVYQMEDFQGTAQRHFHLDTLSGVLTLKAALDREKQSRYSFKVYATDRGFPKQSSFCAVIIRVLDINDNAPKFVYPTQRNHTIYASVFTNPGVALVKLTAVDPDEGENARLSFFLDGPAQHAEIFSLEQHSGELSLVETHEPEKHVGEYSLVLRVQDAGTPSLSSTSNINIVLNKNAKPFGTHSFQPSLSGKQIQLGKAEHRWKYEADIFSNVNPAIHQKTFSNANAQLVRHFVDDAYAKSEKDKQSTIPRVNHFSSEKALVAIICLIALSALIAFTFLLIITLLRRRASALQSRDLPSSGLPETGLSRIGPGIINTYNSKACHLGCTADRILSPTYAKQPLTPSTAWVIGDPKQYPTLSKSTFDYSDQEQYMKLYHNPNDQLTLQLRTGDQDSSIGTHEVGEIKSVHSSDHKDAICSSPNTESQALLFQPPAFGYFTYTCQALSSPESFELLPSNLRTDSPLPHSNCAHTESYPEEINGGRKTQTYGNRNEMQKLRIVQNNNTLDTQVKFSETPDQVGSIPVHRQDRANLVRFTYKRDMNAEPSNSENVSIDMTLERPTVRTPVI